MSKKKSTICNIVKYQKLTKQPRRNKHGNFLFCELKPVYDGTFYVAYCCAVNCKCHGNDIKEVDNDLAA